MSSRSKVLPLFWGKPKLDERGRPRLAIRHRQRYEDYLRNLIGKEVEISIRLYKPTRSLQANAYLWVIYTLIAEHTGHDPEEIHETCKAMFLTSTILLKGKGYRRVGSTATLDTGDFSEYVEKVKKFAGEELGIVVPEPGEASISLTS